MIFGAHDSAHVAGNSFADKSGASRQKNTPAVQTIPLLTNLVYNAIESTSRQGGLEGYSAMSQKFTPKNSSSLQAI